LGLHVRSTRVETVRSRSGERLAPPNPSRLPAFCDSSRRLGNRAKTPPVGLFRFWDVLARNMRMKPLRSVVAIIACGVLGAGADLVAGCRKTSRRRRCRSRRRPHHTRRRRRKPAARSEARASDSARSRSRPARAWRPSLKKCCDARPKLKSARRQQHHHAAAAGL